MLYPGVVSDCGGGVLGSELAVEDCSWWCVGVWPGEGDCDLSGLADEGAVAVSEGSDYAAV